MNAYFDSSALVKPFLREEGWEAADQLWSMTRNPTASVLTYTEVRAALSAARRSGRLTTRTFERAKRLADDRRANLYEIEVRPPLARAAGELAEHYSLRAADAIHLASALATDDPEIVMVTWDGRLRSAAEAVGLPLAPANA